MGHFSYRKPFALILFIDPREVTHWLEKENGQLIITNNKYTTLYSCLNSIYYKISKYHNGSGCFDCELCLFTTNTVYSIDKACYNSYIWNIKDSSK